MGVLLLSIALLVLAFVALCFVKLKGLDPRQLRLAGLLARAVVGWLVYTVLMVPLIVLGFVLVPVMIWGRRYGASVLSYGVNQVPTRVGLAWSDRFMWLWGNDENAIDGSVGSLPPGWPPAGSSTAQRILNWSAWRNNVGNARRTALFGMTVDPARVLRIGNDLKEGPYLAWQGWRFEIRFCWNPAQPDWRKRRYFWLGWRIAQCTEVTREVGLACQPTVTL